MSWVYLPDFILNSPGASWDSDHAQEIMDNVNSIKGEIVTGTFSGAGTPTVITFSDKGNTDYIVVVTPKTTDPSAVGTVSFSPVDATTAEIYNSGSSQCDFVAIIFALA